MAVSRLCHSSNLLVRPFISFIPFLQLWMQYFAEKLPDNVTSNGDDEKDELSADGSVVNSRFLLMEQVVGRRRSFLAFSPPLQPTVVHIPSFHARIFFTPFPFAVSSTWSFATIPPAFFLYPQELKGSTDTYEQIAWFTYLHFTSRAWYVVVGFSATPN